MLSIASMSEGQGNYYADLAREDYYLEGGEPPGVWFGGGVQELGLSAKIERAEFLELFDGFRHGEPLSQSAGQQDRPGWRRRPGWDLSFSAPKSVSTAASQADQETAMEIRAAHISGVEKALRYIEDTAIWTRRGRGGKELESCKALFAMFEHGTSRAQDPQLHTHALLLNIAIRDDGTTGTLETKLLYDLKMAAGAIYRAELAYQLERRLGLFAVRKRSWFELEGVSEPLCEEFSKRRAEIEKVLREKGLSSARASEIAALSTRHVKEHVAREELIRDWRDVGAAFGWSTEQISALCKGPQPERIQGKELDELASKALTTLTENKSYFAERDLVRAMAEGAQTLACGADAVLDQARKFLKNSPDVVRLGTRFKETIYTTKEMLQIEAGLMSQARKGADASPLAVSSECIDAVLSARPTIKAEQADAVGHITQGRGSIAIITGMAGTGKTFTLDAVREALEASGFRVLGAAIAGKAARGLQEGAHIESSTVASLLKRLANSQIVLDAKTVLVLDEAGMVGSRHMKRLVDACALAGSKLVLVGDEKQLQPIEAGGPFASLSKELGSATLSDIERQRDLWARQAVKDFAFGKAAEALAPYAERGLVFVGANSDAAKLALLQAWEGHGLQNPKDNLILAGTNLDVVGLNRRIQEKRLGEGFLRDDSVSVAGEKFHPGDRVLFTRNSKAIGVENGTFGTVSTVNRLSGSISVALDSGEQKIINTKVYEHLKLAYAVTTHKAQGMTAENVFILTSESMQDRELSYVQASRGKGETRFFMTEAEAGEGLKDMIRRMGKSNQKEMAINAAHEPDQAPLAFGSADLASVQDLIHGPAVDMRNIQDLQQEGSTQQRLREEQGIVEIGLRQEAPLTAQELARLQALREQQGIVEVGIMRQENDPASMAKDLAHLQALREAQGIVEIGLRQEAHPAALTAEELARFQASREQQGIVEVGIMRQESGPAPLTPQELAHLEALREKQGIVEVGIVRQGGDLPSSPQHTGPSAAAASPWISLSHYKPFEEGWSSNPYRAVRIPYFAFPFLNKDLRPDNTLWEKSGRPGDLELKTQHIFPKAPDWSPFRNWRIPFLKFTPTPDPLGIVRALAPSNVKLEQELEEQQKREEEERCRQQQRERSKSQSISQSR